MKRKTPTTDPEPMELDVDLYHQITRIRKTAKNGGHALCSEQARDVARALSEAWWTAVQLHSALLREEQSA